MERRRRGRKRERREEGGIVSFCVFFFFVGRERVVFKMGFGGKLMDELG